MDYIAEKKNLTALPALLPFHSWPERKDKTPHLNVGFVSSQGPLLRAIYHPKPHSPNPSQHMLNSNPMTSDLAVLLKSPLGEADHSQVRSINIRDGSVCA